MIYLKRRWFRTIFFVVVLSLMIKFAHANIEQFPINITVAITGFTNAEKADCPSLVNNYGNGSQLGLDIYIKNRIIDGTPGFSKQTLNFKTYVKDVLPNEWAPAISILWPTESLRAGAMATKLAPWYTIKIYETENTKKWKETGAHVVDFTCDQMYKNNSNTNDGNQAVDYTWDYYAVYNGTGTENILNAAYIAGQVANKSKGDGTYMTQWGTQYWALTGKVWEWMFDYYYDNIFLAQSIQIGESLSARIANGQTWKFYLTLNGQEEGFKVDPFFSLSYLQLRVLNPSGTVVASDLSTSYTKSLTINKPQMQAGNWTLEVYASSVSGKYGGFDLTTNFIDTSPEDVAEKTGGINFTSANLNYISTCDPQEGFVAVMKGKEANTTDVLINITNATVQATNAFLTSLIVPNHKMWVTMDTKPGPGFAGKVGDVSKVDGNLSHTELGQIMFDADVQLKMDHFGQSQNLVESLVNNWEENVVGDPSKWPGFYARVWISSDSVTANGTGCKIFITNSTLKVNSVVDAVWVNGGGYQAELAQFKADLEAGLAEIAAEAEIKVNVDPKYEALRRAHASIALAQWYKKQPGENIIYNKLIDSNNLSGLYKNFDQSYYETKAWQYLYSFQYYNNGWNWWDYTVYGGVELTKVNPEVEGELGNHTAELIENATLYSYAAENNSVYFATLKNPNKPDLVPLALGFSSLTPDANEILNITVAVRNEGPANASNFKLKYMESYTSPNDYTAQYLIGEKEITNLASNETALISILTNFSVIGIRNISVEVDYTDVTSELNELNNQINELVNVVNPKPTTSIVAPPNGAPAYVNLPTILTGYGTDYKDESLNESLYEWTSSKDGYLGSGSLIYANLSLGDQVIYLTVEDSDGNKDVDQVIILVLASQPPVITINSPSNSQAFPEGATVYLDGKALDPEDGNIMGNALIWTSSIDGYLGSGGTIFTNSLSVGVHNLTLNATDFSQVSAVSVLSIIIEESTPIINITLPENNATFYYTENSITFNGTATDPHDGDLSSKLNWTSSLDGYLGTGLSFIKALSQGAHLITASVMDSYGLTGLDQTQFVVLEPQPPIVSIISPTNNQQIINGVLFTFKGIATDPETGSLVGNSLSWKSSLNGNLGSGTEFNRSNFTVGSYQIILAAVDNDNQSANVSVNVTVISAPPNVTIVSPVPGSVYSLGWNITFEGTAQDYEDGNLSGNSLVWISDRDGVIGTGNAFTLNNLSSGFHKITLKATDSHNVSSTANVIIPVVGPGSLTFTTLSDGSYIKNLTYAGAGSQVVYIKLPKTANVTNAKLNISGYGVQN
ncbi:MAG TPA: CARDB domain-containing protein [Candidatus Nanoarchaeia archaeon]|nr:CARDB domain-containing protein [Candidatus Nanoarchaeia archaeon]